METNNVFDEFLERIKINIPEDMRKMTVADMIKDDRISISMDIKKPKKKKQKSIELVEREE